MTTKIHATCDALGNPRAFHLTGGQVHDVQGADVLLPELAERIGALFADDASIMVLDVLKANEVEADQTGRKKRLTIEKNTNGGI